MNLFYLDEEENLKEKDIRKNSKKKTEKKEEQNNELFSFDNEIVIGVTKKQEPKKQEKKENKKKNNKNNEIKNGKTSKETNKKQAKNKQTKKSSSNNIKNKQVQKTVANKQEKVTKKNSKAIHVIKYTMLVILFITVILCAMFSPLFNIKTIAVEGNKKIGEKEIISLSQIQIEENTFKLNKNKIIKQIKENPYINKVTITRKLPSNIIIQVEEREATYLLEYAGSYVYLDKQGYMLEINTEKLELPILQGAVTETSELVAGNRLCIEDLEKLTSLLKVMELAKVNELTSLITRIDIENKENIKLIFETKDKVAYLGDNTNLIDKIPLVKKIIEENEGKAGEIFVNMDLNKSNPIFRERV